MTAARAIIGGVERHLGAWKPTGRKFAAPPPALDVTALPEEIPIVSGSHGAFPTDYDQGQIGSCHDDQTEVLTREGWRAFAALTGDEELATVDPATARLTYEKPTRLVRFRFAGDMVCARNSYLDFKVTPDHKMLVRTWNQSRTTLNEHYELVPAAELGWYVGLMNRVQWDGAPGTRDAYVLPGVEHHHMPQRADAEVSMRTWLRFLGLYLAEGTMIGPKPSKEANYRIQIAASKEREKQFARAVLLELGVAPGEQHDRFQFSNKRIFEALEGLGLRGVQAPDKFVPAFVFELGADLIGEFLLGHFMGDGCQHRGTRAHYTSSARLADDLQRLAFLTGNESGISTRPARSSTMVDGREIVARHPEHRVSVRERRHASIERKETIFREHYDGDVFCAEVPTHHTLVTRRNGCILISGNCGPNSVGEVFEFDLGAKFSRLFIYYWTRATERDVDEDAGVTIPDLLDVASAMGMPLEETWPYDTTRLRDVPTLAAIAEAFKHRVVRNDVVADLPHLLYELASGQPVTFGFQVPSAMQSMEVAITGVVPMPQSADDAIGGHCVNAVAASRSRQLVRCTSHYGAKFGDGGTLWLPFAMFEQGFASDMRAIRSVSG